MKKGKDDNEHTNYWQTIIRDIVPDETGLLMVGIFTITNK